MDWNRVERIETKYYGADENPSFESRMLCYDYSTERLFLFYRSRWNSDYDKIEYIDQEDDNNAMHD